MDTLKKFFLNVLALTTSGLILLATGSLYLQKQLTPPPAEKVGSATNSLEIRTSDGDNNASTTLTYVKKDTATTTLTFLSERATSIDYNLMVTASSSAGVLVMRRSFSNNGVDWYAETCRSATSVTLVTYGQAPCTMTVPLATSTAAAAGNALGVNVPLDPVASKYTRVYLSTMGADASYFLQSVLKEPNQN